MGSTPCALQQAMTHGVVVLEPIVVIRFYALNRSAPILESDGIRRQNHEASTGKRRPESLERIAHLTRYLALAEMKFPIVLMEYNHPAQRLAPLWREQQSRNEITFESPVLDPFTKEPIEFLDVATPDFHRRRLRKSKAIAKHRGEVGHHPRMIVRNAACFMHKRERPDHRGRGAHPNGTIEAQRCC